VSSEHVSYIRECIRLAEEAKRNGNHPFGSILVHDGEIILREVNQVVTANDVSKHPEIMLAVAGASKYSADFLAECTLYTSTEPCPMCSGAIYWSGIGRVIFACSGEKLYEYAADGLHVSCREIFEKGDRKVEVIGPILEDEAVQVHVGFWENL
jgi:tRNA(Arg) A34 adenosine deaminase TadA